MGLVSDMAGREVGRAFPTRVILQTSLGTVCFFLFLLFAGVLVGLSSHPRGVFWSFMAFHCLNFSETLQSQISPKFSLLELWPNAAISPRAK